VRGPLPPGLPAAVLFDWDNTLVDTLPVIQAALAETFRTYGRTSWTLEEVKRNVRLSARDAFPLLFGDQAQEAQRVFYDAFRARHLDALTAMPQAADLLEFLAGWAVPMAVVSNKGGPLLRKEVSHLGWERFFGSVVGAGDAARDKPAGDPALLALEQLGLSPGRGVWFVGDTDVDLACAHAAGLSAVLLRGTPPQTGEFATEPPDAHFTEAQAFRTAVEDRSGAVREPLPGHNVRA